MIPAIAALTAAYVAVAALLLHLNLASRHSVGVKLVAIAVVTACYALAWHGSLGLLGWPTPDALPPAFRVHGIWLDEPNRGGDGGGIYFWVRRLDAAERPVGQPRLHRLPWSKQVAESAQSALEELEGGALLDGYLSGQAGQGEARGKGGTNSDGSVLPSAEEERPPLEFRRVPAPELPPKEAPPRY